MAIWKYELLCDYASNVSGASIGRRTGGWSEGVYSSLAPTATFQGKQNRFHFMDLCAARAALLPAGASIVGQRYSQVDPKGGSTTDARVFPGNPAFPSDAPQMALFLKLRALDTPNVKPLTIRCVPDGVVREGEWFPIAPFTGAYEAYVKQLALWQFKARDLTATQFNLVSVDSNGLATTEVAHSFIAGNRVRVLRSIDDRGQRRGGLFTVVAPVTTFTLTLQRWLQDVGEDCVGGRARLDATIYPAIATQDAPTPTTIVRKVGRPSKQYHGKASTRR